MELGRRETLLGIILFLALICLPSFLEHYWYWLSGQAESIVVQQRWDIAFLNIAGFLLFLLPLKYRRKADWRSYGIYTAFIVSLFVEMYGVPLTIYLTSGYLGTSSVQASNAVLQFSLLGQGFSMTPWMVVGALTTILGMAVVAWGWLKIYRTDEELVESGIYSYSRHPQYLGIVLIAVGWFIGWPTLLTTALLPVLLYTYYKLALKEEKEVEEHVGNGKYDRYCENTRMFI